MIKRILSFIGLVLGAVGTVLCLAVIIGAWWVNGPITVSVLNLFSPIERALSFGDTAANRFGDFVADTQTQFTQATDAKPLATALEDEIQQIALYVDVASAVADSAEQAVSGVVESIQPSINQPTVNQPTVKGIIISRSVGKLLETLTDVTNTLDVAEALAQDIRVGRIEKIDALNEQLDTLQERAVEVQTTLAQTKDDVVSIKRKVSRWIDLGSLLVTFIFVWFGAAQYSLLRVCWRALRSKKTDRDDAVDALNEQIEALQLQLTELKSVI